MRRGQRGDVVAVWCSAGCGRKAVGGSAVLDWDDMNGGASAVVDALDRAVTASLLDDLERVL